MSSRRYRLADDETQETRSRILITGQSGGPLLPFAIVDPSRVDAYLELFRARNNTMPGRTRPGT